MEKAKKRLKRLEQMKPGARRAITEGIAHHKSILDVMRDEAERRKYERQQKYKDK